MSERIYARDYDRVWHLVTHRFEGTMTASFECKPNVATTVLVFAASPSRVEYVKPIYCAECASHVHGNASSSSTGA